MATGDTLGTLKPIDGFPEVQGAPDGGAFGLVNVGLAQGLSFPPKTDSGATFIGRLPTTASLATGATVTLLLADDILNPGPGLVARFAVTWKLLATSTDVIDWTVAGTETGVSVTMPSTSGVVVTAAFPVVVANMDSLAAGNFFALRVRRLGKSSTADTHTGRVVVVAGDIRDT